MGTSRSASHVAASPVSSAYAAARAAGPSPAAPRAAISSRGTNSPHTNDSKPPLYARVWNVVLALLVMIAAVLAIAFAGVRLVGLEPYVVLSGSMEPEIPTGSLIYVRAADPTEVQVGDTITFSLESGTRVTHQVWQIDAEQRLFYTQGIANKTAEGEISHDGAPVSWDDFLGVPVSCIPNLGYLNVWITTAPGLYVVIAAVVIVLCMTLIIELLTKNREEAEAEAAAQAEPATDAPAGDARLVPIAAPIQDGSLYGGVAVAAPTSGASALAADVPEDGTFEPAMPVSAAPEPPAGGSRGRHFKAPSTEVEGH